MPKKKSFCQVLEPGFYTSIQDSGRRGWRGKGVPLSGPMDTESFARANRVVGNDTPQAALEITLSGPTLLFNDPVWVAVSGAEVALTHNQNVQALDRPFLCDLGDVLRVGKMTHGARVYMAFLGGLQSSHYLGSASQFFPISPADRVQKGEKLSYVTSLLFPEITASTGKINSQSLGVRDRLKVRRGIDWDDCPKHIQKELKKGSFVVGSNNRMGYRLEGTISPLDFQPLSGIIPPGTIQLSSGGALLVAMADGQVTGGYLRVLSLDSAEMNFLAQQTTGKKLRLDFMDE